MNIDIANRLRETLPLTNQFDIGELLALPSFYGFVDCSPASTVRFKMFLAGSDDGVALRFFWNGCYEPHSLALWSRLASISEGLIVDVGAHTGSYSLAALAVKPNKVLSFEPYFMNYSRLLLNMRLNAFSRAGAYMLALSDVSGLSDFSVSTGLDYLSTGGALGVRNEGHNYPVRTVSLDLFSAEKNLERISLLKIDVEGHELSVLKGSREILHKYRPLIFFECIESTVCEELEQFLRRLDYEFLLIDDNSLAALPVEGLKPERLKDGSIDKYKLNRIAYSSRDKDKVYKSLLI